MLGLIHPGGWCAPAPVSTTVGWLLKGPKKNRLESTTGRCQKGERGRRRETAMCGLPFIHSFVLPHFPFYIFIEFIIRK